MEGNGKEWIAMGMGWTQNKNDFSFLMHNYSGSEYIITYKQKLNPF